jgi:hypothetical protein
MNLTRSWLTDGAALAAWLGVRLLLMDAARTTDSQDPLSTLRALANATEGSTAYIIGGVSRQSGQADIGKFTLSLRKSAEGRRLIMSDMDNGNSRPSPR